MEIIGAAALIAVGIVVAAVLYGRSHGAGPASAERDTAAAAALQAALGERSTALERREEALERREAELAGQREEVTRERAEVENSLERVAGISAARAKELLLQEIEEQARHASARKIREIEEETKREAERRVRNILSVVMQRLAAGHAAETTVSVVQLATDDMKGRIIGREGRNIRALENLTGVDFIIDDTPGAVVLSGFDGVRREIARLTLEKLLQDGRIHPARIEEMYYQTKSEMEGHIVELGEQGAFDAGVQGLHPELVKLLGRLRFRTSYGQNVLAHSIEVSQLSAMMAQELGASAKTARRAALLHDIGKSVTHEIEGPHALVGGDLARKYGESAAVATPWRRTTTRSSPRRSRPSSSKPPTRCPERARARAASRSSSTSSACATWSRSPPATRAWTRSTRCRRDARSGSWSPLGTSMTTPRPSCPTRSPARSRRSSSIPARSR